MSIPSSNTVVNSIDEVENRKSMASNSNADNKIYEKKKTVCLIKMENVHQKNSSQRIRQGNEVSNASITHIDIALIKFNQKYT